VRRKEFERLVTEAITDLPQEFRDRLETVAILIEDSPSDELLDRMEVDEDDTLLGLYEGTPLTERGFDAPLHPDCIWIFQKPLEQVSDDPATVREEIRLTIMHEVAHFFGIEDDALDEMGY
jgi:predicted Zn-dependent protease with MMP-like domain